MMKFGFSLQPSDFILQKHPFIEPHLHPVRLQPLRQRARHRLILRAVAEENFVGEFGGVVGHSVQEIVVISFTAAL